MTKERILAEINAHFDTALDLNYKSLTLAIDRDGDEVSLSVSGDKGRKSFHSATTVFLGDEAVKEEQSEEAGESSSTHLKVG